MRNKNLLTHHDLNLGDIIITHPIDVLRTNVRVGRIIAINKEATSTLPGSEFLTVFLIDCCLAKNYAEKSFTRTNFFMKLIPPIHNIEKISEEELTLLILQSDAKETRHGV